MPCVPHLSETHSVRFVVAYVELFVTGSHYVALAD